MSMKSLSILQRDCNNVHMKRMVAAAISGPLLCLGSVGISLEAGLENWLRVVALLVGIISALISMVIMFRLNQVKLAVERKRMCVICRGLLSHPRICPIPSEDRPGTCPLN